MRVFWFLCVVAMAAACSSDEPAAKGIDEGCVINTDCQSPLVCAFRKCHQACVTSRDCPSGQRCMASDRPFHVCQLADERVCSFNSDCPPGQVCGIDGQCRDQCAADRDCLSEQTCVASTCADNTELADGGLVGAPLAEGGPPVSGVPCLYTSECPDPLICRNKICSSECLTPADCAAGSDCVDNRCVAGSGTLIGSEGGVVTVGGGKVTLTIPPGSLRSPVSILILPLEAWPAGALGQAYQILPSGLQFDPAATLVFKYSTADVSATPTDQLKIASAVGSKWTPLASNVDVAKQTVSASLAHLSTYGLVGPTVSVDAGNGGSGGSGDASGTDAGSSVDASLGADVSTVDAAALPNCEVSCVMNVNGLCSCGTVGSCNGHSYGCSGTNATCECIHDDNTDMTLTNIVACQPSLLTDQPAAGCGYPFNAIPYAP